MKQQSLRFNQPTGLIDLAHFPITMAAASFHSTLLAFQRIRVDWPDGVGGCDDHVCGMMVVEAPPCKGGVHCFAQSLKCHLASGVHQSQLKVQPCSLSVNSQILVWLESKNLVCSS